MFAGMPYALRILHRLSLCTLSKAFWKSIKLMYNPLCHSWHCSMMFLKEKMCSVQPRPFLKPACSCRSTSLTAKERRFTITLQKILLGRDKRVIPRQLLRSDSVPFLGIGMMTPLLQSFGIPSPFHTLAKSGSNISAASSGWHLKSSALSWSCQVLYHS